MVGTSAMLERTEFSHLWRVILRSPCEGEPFDPVLESALLRHRPSSLAAVSWFMEEQKAIVFTTHHGELLPLSERLPAFDRDQETGLALLEGILRAIDDAQNFLFPVNRTLLSPDLIFLDRKSTSDSFVKIVCLPCHDTIDFSEESQDHLMDALAQHFHWDEDQFEALNDRYQNNDFALLYEEVLALNGKTKTVLDDAPQEASPRITRRVKQKEYSKKTNLGAGSFFSFIKGLFRPGDGDLLHEMTEDLDLSAKTKIAQLSEGLPGTPEEEYGRRAFILADEFVVGRDLKDVDLCLDSQAISRRHARILLKEGHYFLEDLGSSNGTSLDGIRLSRKREYLLPDKCRIAFAGEHFYFRSE